MKTRTRSAPIGDQEAISREPVSSDQQFAARPEVAQALSTVSALEQQYVTYQVKTVEQYTASADDLKAIKRAQDAVQAEADKIVKPAYATYKAALGFFQKPLGRLAAIEERIKGALRNYQDEQRRIQAKRQAEAEEAARKEREKLEARAAREAAKGREDKAEALQLQAQSVVAHVPVVETPKIAGLSRAEKWTYRIKNPDLIPDSFWMLDEAKIGKLARSLKKDAIPVLGGAEAIEIWDEGNIRSGK